MIYMPYLTGNEIVHQRMAEVATRYDRRQVDLMREYIDRKYRLDTEQAEAVYKIDRAAVDRDILISRKLDEIANA